MIERIKLPFPMWRVQYDLLGGHRRMMAIAVVIILAVIVGTVTMRRIFHDDPASIVCTYILNAIGFAQAIVLIPGGCNAIYRATLRDFESKMIESHRLTPMTSFEVTLGYLFGATLQALVIGLVLAACGFVLSLMGDLSGGDWILANVVIISTALPLWSMIVASGVRPAKPISPAPFIFTAFPLSTGLIAVPGLGVVTGIYGLFIAYYVGTRTTGFSRGAVAALVAINAVLSCYWVYIAATKYRRPDLPVLNGARGLVLLFLWLGVALGGVITYDAVAGQTQWFDQGQGMSAFQWIASMIVSIPVAAIIVMATSACRALVSSGRAPRGWADRLPDLPYAIGVALLAVGVMFLVGMLTPIRTVFGTDGKPLALTTVYQGSSESRPFFNLLLVTTLAFVFAMVCVRGAYRFLFRDGRPAVKWPAVMTLAGLAAAWGLPPLTDIILASAVEEQNEITRLTVLTASSPGGIIGAAWSGVAVPEKWGLLIQGAAAFLLTILGIRSRPRNP